MKIVVVDNMLLPYDPNSVPGGTERRNISDAFALSAMHDVYLTVVGPKSMAQPTSGPGLIRLHTRGKEEPVPEGESPRAWQKHVTEKFVKFLDKFQPDVVHYGCNSHFWLAKEIVRRHIPINIQIGNYLSGNNLYDLGRLKDLFYLKKMGAHFVFNTQTCADIFHEQIKTLMSKVDPPDWLVPTILTNHVNVNNAGVGFVGNPIDGPVRSEGGYAVIAARADPSKRVGSFSWVDFPLVVFLKYRSSTDKNGYYDKLITSLEANPNITVKANRPYDEVMTGISEARALIVSWPDETFGLTAFEAASFGVPSIVFRRDENDRNATAEFLEDIQAPVEFAYNDKEWRKKLSAFMTKPSLIEARRRLVNRCRKRYSYEDYLKERTSSLLMAIRVMRKTVKKEKLE